MTPSPADLIAWAPLYETGLEHVDGQHRHLFDLVNRVARAAASPQGLDDAEHRALLADLVAYAEEHFRDEMQLMREAGVDARHTRFHGRQHEAFIREVRQLGERQADGGTRRLLRFLLSWLTYHILGVDHSMARQMDLIRAGCTPQRAYAIDGRQRAEARGAQPLLDALESLVDQLGDRNRALEAINQSLEQRVQARTRELEEANRRLEEMALTDMLTGLANRRAGLARLEQVCGACDPAAPPLSVLVVDADHFKPVNDTHGHDAGDRVLRTLAKTLAGAVRTDDMVCRMGGDEFLVICPDTPLAGAHRVAEEAWRQVNALRVPVGDGEWRGSISVGVAERTPDTRRPLDLLRIADMALYRAKEDGRNCVRTAPETGSRPSTARELGTISGS